MFNGKTNSFLPFVLVIFLNSSMVFAVEKLSSPPFPLNSTPRCIGNCENGDGTEVQKDGSVYKGHHLNSKASGQGEFWAKDGTHYKGNFVEDKPSGQGELWITDGGHYLGGFKDNKFSGQGEYWWPTGDFYSGQWENGARTGEGYFQSKDYKYKGHFVNGQTLGHGEDWYPNSDHFVSEFLDGNRTSTSLSESTLPPLPSKLYPISTSWLANHCTGNCKNGKGTFIYPTGESYMGQWKDGELSGQGEFYWSDGAYYSGQFQSGERTGEGLFKFGGASKYKYQGHFVNGKASGHGEEWQGDASHYVGEFTDGHHDMSMPAQGSLTGIPSDFPKISTSDGNTKPVYTYKYGDKEDLALGVNFGGFIPYDYGYKPSNPIDLKCSVSPALPKGAKLSPGTQPDGIPGCFFYGMIYSLTPANTYAFVVSTPKGTMTRYLPITTHEVFIVPMVDENIMSNDYQCERVTQVEFQTKYLPMYERAYKNKCTTSIYSSYIYVTCGAKEVEFFGSAMIQGSCKLPHFASDRVSAKETADLVARADKMNRETRESDERRDAASAAAAAAAQQRYNGVPQDRTGAAIGSWQKDSHGNVYISPRGGYSQ